MRYNPAANYSNSNFDVRHAFKGYVVYQLPFGRGKQFLNGNRYLDEAVGGWQVAGTVILQTGNPFTVYGRSGQLFAGRYDVSKLESGSQLEAIRQIKPINEWFNSGGIPSAGGWNLGQREKEQPLGSGDQRFQSCRPPNPSNCRGERESESSSVPMRRTSSIIPASALRAVLSLGGAAGGGPTLRPAQPLQFVNSQRTQPAAWASCELLIWASWASGQRRRFFRRLFFFASYS